MADKKETHRTPKASESQGSSQIVEGSIIGKGVRQTSDVGNTEQRMTYSTAEMLDQKIGSQPPTITMFGVTAKGLVAVLVACLVVIVLLFLKYSS